MKNHIRRIAALVTAMVLLVSGVPLGGLVAEAVPSAFGGDRLSAPADTQQITITFAIMDAAYTSDPGSGDTHITAQEVFPGGDLGYTSWAGRYKMTGTGTLCSYTIPAGTTLEQNGISLPAISVENIGSNNTYTYISSRSWITPEGMVCNGDTVFSEDTTLSLSLYTNDSNYSLNFVCAEGENHSVTYALGGYPSATFALGQSVSAPYIPTAEAVNAGYNGTGCSHGPSVGEVFVKWQLKNTATGEMVDFAAGTPITADYGEDGSHSIKVYAVWGEPVTATFQNGDEVVESRQLVSGAAVGTLPAAEEPEDHVFLGWEYTDDQGEVQIANADTVITQDTVFTARFAAEQNCQITFHDVRPNGTSQTTTATVHAGSTMAEAIAQAERSHWGDGTSLAECIWYAYLEGDKVPQTTDTPISQDMAFYTHTYQLELAFESEVQNALTITAREGQPLSASDFVVSGQDYSAYSWLLEDGEELDILSLIAEGLTENISATGTKEEQRIGEIRFYVAIDGEWVLLDNRTMSLFEIGDRYYLSGAQLESIYGEYGFTADMLTTETKYFPHTERGSNTIWADVKPVEQDGIVYSPILKRETGTNCNVYYLPKRDCQDSGDREKFVENNSFYTVRVQDPAHQVYPDGMLPPVSYTLSGDTAEVTVNTSAGVTWECVGSNGSTVAGSNNPDGTITFTISNISQPYVISPVLAENQVLITYDIRLPQPPSDADYGAPTISGASVYTTAGTKGGSHTVLAPSMTQYFYDSGKYVGEAVFQGWAVNGDTNHLVQPGESYAVPEGVEEISFVAQWTTHLGGTSSPAGSTMVNFFVALTAIPEGGSSWVGSTQSNFFTGSVFTTDCGVLGRTAIDQELYREEVAGGGTYRQYIVGGATSGNNLNAIHNTLVQTLTAGYTMEGADGKEYTYRLQFPTDEEVLRQIRRMVEEGTVIQVNGRTVRAENITSEKFTIRWHVFKLDNTDGWHVDGVLVARTGSLKVTKTFSGDAAAIQAIQQDYSIDVKYVKNDYTPANIGGTLRLTDENVQYDPSTNTYTWVLPVDQYRDYTIQENNYQSGETGITTNAQYNISSSVFIGQNTDGWQPYVDAITITGQTLAAGEQTVALLNTYTQTGVMVLEKVDALTGAFMPGIAFTVARQDGQPLALYDLGENHYTVDSQAGGTLVSENRVVTDAKGQIFLYLGVGTFTFTESVPQGYEDPGEITVTLGEDGTINRASAENASPGREVVRFSGTTLRVRNYSRMVPLTVKKIWADGENTAVVLQVFCNGQNMGSDYAVTLDGSSTGWSHTYSVTVPLYINGQPAQYSLREMQIGNWSYSQEYGGDGYRYYDVSYTPMEYHTVSGETATLETAGEIFLSVTNQRTQVATEIRKVDQDGVALPDGIFYLYDAPSNGEPSVTVTQDGDGNNILEGQPPSRTAISDPYGWIDFGLLPGGSYYLIEHQAPPGYLGTDALYLLEVQGTGTTLKRWTSDQWVTVSDKTIANQKNTVEVNIEKLVSGNLGIQSQSFQFTVTADKTIYSGQGYTVSDDGKTASFQLVHGQDVTLIVEKGAVLTIQESNADGYTMTLQVNGSSVEGNCYTVPTDNTKVVDLQVVNTKTTIPDAGVVLDTLPYLLILGVVVIAAFFLLRRGKRRDDT